MLDAYIIEEIRRQEEARRIEEGRRPRLQIDLPRREIEAPADDTDADPEDAPTSDVIIRIDL